MESFSRRHALLLGAVSLLWVTVAVSLVAALRRSEGHLVYALDDPYIHMATARNLAEHGVWGVTPFAFTSSSSSVLWPLLLAGAYRLFGPSDLIPLALNLALATLLLITLDTLFRRYRLPAWLRAPALLLVIFAAPLPALIFSGLEHILHALLAVLFVHLFARWVVDRPPGRREAGQLALVAALLVMARYEGLFLLAGAVALLVLRRRLFDAAWLGLAGVLPIAVYGLVSVSRGWYFLPNSVLLKGQGIDLSSLKHIVLFLWGPFVTIGQHPHLLIPAIAALALGQARLHRQQDFWDAPNVMVGLFVLNLFFHAQFARLGYFFRYEAYLITLGCFTIGAALGDVLPTGRTFRRNQAALPVVVSAALLVALVSGPFVTRALIALQRTPVAVGNIYEQQYQIGLFLREFYPHQCVAANDIGAINYLAEIQCLDLEGLASREVARAKRGGYYSSAYIRELAARSGAKVAIVYDDWFDEFGGLPKEWIQVERWSIPENLVCGGDTVSFYAVDPSEADRLRAHLAAFAGRLPRQVSQRPGHDLRAAGGPGQLTGADHAW